MLVSIECFVSSLLKFSVRRRSHLRVLARRGGCLKVGTVSSLTVFGIDLGTTYSTRAWVSRRTDAWRLSPTTRVTASLLYTSPSPTRSDSSESPHCETPHRPRVRRQGGSARREAGLCRDRQQRRHSLSACLSLSVCAPAPLFLISLLAPFCPLSVCLSLCSDNFVSISPPCFECFLSVYLSVRSSVCLSACLSGLFVCLLFVSLSVPDLSVCLSLCLSVCSSILDLSACFSMRMSFVCCAPASAPCPTTPSYHLSYLARTT